ARQLVRVPRPPPGPVRGAGVAGREPPQRRLRLKSVEPAQESHELGRPAPHLGGDGRVAPPACGGRHAHLARDHDLAPLVGSEFDAVTGSEPQHLAHPSGKGHLALDRYSCPHGCCCTTSLVAAQGSSYRQTPTRYVGLPAPAVPAVTGREPL